MTAITKVGTVGIPSTDTRRSRAFYVETRELRPDLDPGGNPLTLHRPYAVYDDGTTP